MIELREAARDKVTGAEARGRREWQLMSSARGVTTHTEARSSEHSFLEKKVTRAMCMDPSDANFVLVLEYVN